jgi:WD40 repeat protein
LPSISDDGSIKLHDPASGEQLQGLEDRVGDWRRGFFSPDGILLAFYSDFNTLKVYNRVTKKTKTLLLPQPPEIHHYPVYFSPNGNVLAFVQEDKSVRLWDTHTGEHLQMLHWHSKEIMDSAWPGTHRLMIFIFLSDSRPVASLCFCGEIKIFHTQSGRTIQRITQPTTTCLVFSSDGTALAGGCWGINTATFIKIWDTSTGKETHTRKVGRLRTVISDVVFSPISMAVAIGVQHVYEHNDVVIWLWETHSDQLLEAKLDVPYLPWLRFSDDAKYLVTERGILEMENSAPADTEPATHPPELLASKKWITVAGENLIWIPPNYRRQVALHGRHVALLHESGRLITIQFILWCISYTY